MPEKFVIVDENLKPIKPTKKSSDYDRLTDIVDRHNEDFDDHWFVVSESDLQITRSNQRSNAKRNPKNEAWVLVTADNDLIGYGKDREEFEDMANRHNRRKDVTGGDQWVVLSADIYELILERRRSRQNPKNPTKKLFAVMAFNATGKPILQSTVIATSRADAQKQMRSDLKTLKLKASKFAIIQLKDKTGMFDAVTKQTRKSKNNSPISYEFRAAIIDEVNRIKNSKTKNPISKEFREAVTKEADRLSDDSAKLKKLINKAKKNYEETDFFDDKALDEISAQFQGSISGEEVEVISPTATPPRVVRLGRLRKLILINGGEIEINFRDTEDAWLAADRRRNLYIIGADATIPSKKAKPNQLRFLGQLKQFNYVTRKSHIENGELIEYFHESGEVDGVLPSIYTDHNGHLVLLGGNYDIWTCGVVN